MLRVLVVDDEPPAREELAYLLGRDARVDTVQAAGGAEEALLALEQESPDAVFCDIRMPGLSGLDLARVLARFVRPPSVVFVSAYDDHAVDAFEVDAVDYLLKPVRTERLTEAIRRVIERRERLQKPTDTDTIPVELGGVTRFVPRREVLYVEAHGDYARLHTTQGSHLVRVALSTLEEQWRSAGFVRIHRRLLVALAHVEEMRYEAGRCTVRVGGTQLQVSRRHTPELREMVRQQGLQRRELGEPPDPAGSA